MLEAASALLAALVAPVVLTWELGLPSGGFAALSAEAAPLVPGAAAEWPPAHLTLRVGSARPHPGGGAARGGSELRVPSKLTAEQLAVVLSGGLAAGAEQELPAPPGALAPPPPPLLDADPEHRIAQPRCLGQWHGDVCGHHALFNARQLLLGLPASADAPPPSVLLDEASFWRGALDDIEALAALGEGTGRWPRSRVTCGILDGIHAKQLVQGDGFLRGRVSVVEAPEGLGPETPAGQALAAVAAGREAAHGFVLGCAIHWLALVAVKVPSGPRLWLCDSHNRPMARLLALGDVRELAEEHELRWRERARQGLRARPEWEHQPASNIEKALDEGVPEWWKGARKTPLFWRWKPRDVRLALAVQELEYMRHYLETFVAALG